MEAKIHDHSAVKDENIAETGSGRAGKEHRTDFETEEEKTTVAKKESDSTEFGKSNKDLPRGFADRANNISTLNEDKSTISDTSAPSGSMQNKENS